MYLPNHNNLSIEKLSQIFNNMTNSYKALLFKSLIDVLQVERRKVGNDGEIDISYSELCVNLYNL